MRNGRNITAETYRFLKRQDVGLTATSSEIAGFMSQELHFPVDPNNVASALYHFHEKQLLKRSKLKDTRFYQYEVTEAFKNSNLQFVSAKCEYNQNSKTRVKLFETPQLDFNIPAVELGSILKQPLAEKDLLTILMETFIANGEKLAIELFKAKHREDAVTISEFLDRLNPISTK